MSAQQRHSDALDDVFRLAPIASLYTLRIAGVQNCYSWEESVLANVATLGISYGVTQVMKHAVDAERPDGSDLRSFPSGHAAVAFAGAHALHKEYGHVSPWISVAGYGVATFVAVDRVAKDRHHWYDVCAGAALGMASTEAGYWLSSRIFKDDKVSMSFTGNRLDVVLVW